MNFRVVLKGSARDKRRIQVAMRTGTLRHTVTLRRLELARFNVLTDLKNKAPCIHDVHPLTDVFENNACGAQT